MWRTVVVVEVIQFNNAQQEKRASPENIPRNAPRQFGMRQPRPPPGAVSTAPVALACAFAAAYYTYGVHYSTAVTNSSSNATKTTPWWRPSN